MALLHKHLKVKMPLYATINSIALWSNKFRFT